MNALRLKGMIATSGSWWGNFLQYRLRKYGFAAPQFNRSSIEGEAK